MDPLDDRRGPRLLARLLFGAGLLAALLALAACGGGSSSSSSSSSTEEPATSGETTGEETGGGTTEEIAGFHPDPEKVYAEGVPTLNELYEGNEEPPPSSGPPAAQDKEVLYMTCGLESVGCSSTAEAFEEARKVLGWKGHVLDGKLNVGDGYANAIRTGIAAKPDAMIVYGLNCDEAKQALTEAKEAGIVLVESSSVDCDDPRIGGERLYTVHNWFRKDAKDTAEFYGAFGRQQANYIIDATEGKAKAIMAEFQGLFGKNMGENWKEAFEQCAECEILETVPWEVTDVAPNGPLFQKFNTALLKYPEANAADAAFDPMATYSGISKAVLDAGRADSMVVTGGEGTAEALEVIAEGKGLTADPPALDAGRLIWGVMDNLNRYFAGEKEVPEGVGFTAVDKNHNMPPKGQEFESPIDFRKAYEEVWKGK